MVGLIIEYLRKVGLYFRSARGLGIEERRTLRRPRYNKFLQRISEQQHSLDAGLCSEARCIFELELQ